MTEQDRTIHLQIHGRVQGVNFRAWTAEQAKNRSLSGWVRNRRDGSVEAVFQGAPENVAEMIDLCRDGPLDAKVENVEIIQEGGVAPPGFEVRPTE